MLAELIEIVQGPFRLALCCRPGIGRDEEDCHMEEVCPIREPVRKVHRVLARYFGGVSLAQLTFDSVPVDLRVPDAAQPRNSKTDQLELG